ncbi:MAG: 3-deoxy-D-manno-octulosonic acid transferase [Niabella sp.]
MLYNIFIFLYRAGISVATLLNPKAKLWKKGRKNIFYRLEQDMQDSRQVIWMHCASLGEFEQGRPVLESLRKNYPLHKILLTFFSPSGYEIRKNYQGADWVYYLPLDTKCNVRRFLKIVNPSLVIFVKYEYWYNYLHQLSKNHVPTILISAIFRKDKVFFKWYGGFHRKMLNYFSHIFVQDAESKDLIKGLVSDEKITVAGDTRFDRVAELASAFQPVAPIEKFIQGKKIIVAGSTWPDDERNLNTLLNEMEGNISLIIAPHEVDSNHIGNLQKLFTNSILYTALSSEKITNTAIANSRVLIINNIGLLSRLYYSADIAYIGGGFNSSGIHNTLEAAVYGKPVIFGPNYQKFSEAVSLVALGGGFSYQSAPELTAITQQLLDESDILKISGKVAGSFVKENTGATAIILGHIRKSVF